MIAKILREPHRANSYLQVTLTHAQLLFLQRYAEKSRVTVSWILRSLLRQHLKAYLKNLPSRPNEIGAHTTRFNIVFHRLSDKEYYSSLVHRQNRPIATILRQMIDDLEKGCIALTASLLDTKEYQSWVEEVTEERIEGQCCVVQQHTKLWMVNKLDYWPQNPHGYLNLMKLGRKNRIYRLISS